MDKRYQVFLSSTYGDLKDERQKVIQTLMEMDCIPSGMELFPAADEEQWEFIKKVIDDCDYYLLIIGGRYGSTTAEGISYTEKEYDYAIDRGLKVIAFLHEDPDTIPSGKTDKNPALAEKLAQFRAKVQQNRLIRSWKTAGELPGLVSLSLSKTIKTYPAVGWVRATAAGTSELLAEIHTLRKENEELRSKVQLLERSTRVAIENIAGMDESFELQGDYRPNSNSSTKAWKHSVTWNQIFAFIAPYLLEHPSNISVRLRLKESVLEHAGISWWQQSSSLNEQTFQTVKIQLMAYGLVDVFYTQTTKGGMGLFWNITDKGQSLMMQLRTVRASA
jgi:hypothetical protein